MKNIGIIAEYNPFHNGHLYQLNKCKEILEYNNAICILSGNFVQKGLPASYNKWIRAKMALLSGINLVIELPTYYSVNSAEFFASESINILNSLGIVDNICFGAENDNINILKQIAKILSDEPTEFVSILKENLDKGFSFPVAREKAFLTYINDNNYTNILNKPNNILAIEYLKALIKQNSAIQPICIKRKYSGYNDITINSNLCSATAIRELMNKKDISKSDIQKLKNIVPNNVFTLMRNESLNSIYNNSLKKYESQIIYIIRKMTIGEINNILEVSEGLDVRLKKYAFQTNDIYELMNLVKSKRFTLSRIQRIMIHILLNMTKTEFDYIQKNNYSFARILGFDEKGETILKQISKTSKIPIITSLNRYMKKNENNILLEKDILATNIYTEKYNQDYTKEIVKI